MGLKNYFKKFKECDFSKVVGEISTLIIFEKRSAKLLKKLFPETKIIIYRRNEKDRVRSARNVAINYDLVEDTSISKNPVTKINQEEYIKPWLDEFGKEKVFIFNMDRSDKQEELNRMFKFLNVCKFTPTKINERTNQSYSDKNRKEVLKVKRKGARKMINLVKYFLKRYRKTYYFFKRNLGMDYYYQLINHNL